MKKIGKNPDPESMAGLIARVQDTYVLQAEIWMKQIKLLHGFLRIRQALRDQGTPSGKDQPLYKSSLLAVTEQIDRLEERLLCNKTLSRKVEDLPLQRAIRDILKKAGCLTFFDLVCLTEKEFANLPGMNKKDHFEEVVRMLAVLYFHFRTE